MLKPGTPSPKSISHQRGLTLIELMTTLSIASVLAALAMPGFTSFLRNTEVRGSSESMLQGLQLARAEAIRQNRRICYDWSGTGTGWVVSTGCLNAPSGPIASQVIQQSTDREGSKVSLITMTPAGSQRVMFNGYGRVVPNTVGGASITRIDITATAANLQRRIQVSAGDFSGRLFVCDPSAATGTQMACS